jgi:hypothetical protein
MKCQFTITSDGRVHICGEHATWKHMQPTQPVRFFCDAHKRELEDDGEFRSVYWRRTRGLRRKVAA